MNPVDVPIAGTLDEDGVTPPEKALAEQYARQGFSSPVNASREAFPHLKKDHADHFGAAAILRRPHVQVYLNYLRDRVDWELRADRDDLIRLWKRLAFYDPRQALDPETGEYLTVAEMPESIVYGIEKLETVTLPDGRTGQRVVFTDRIMAMRELGKILGVYEADNSQKSGMVAFLASAASATSASAGMALEAPADGPPSVAGPNLALEQPVLPG